MERWKYSPITWAIERAFHLLTYLPPQVIMRRILRSRIQADHSNTRSPELTAQRARGVEYFLVAYYILDVLAFASSFTNLTLLKLTAFLWAVLRLIDIIQTSAAVTLFDRIRGYQDNRVASQTRLIVLAIINYFELILCFATVYAVGYLGALKSTNGPWGALYFSVLTQLTVSFGDITPDGWLRVVAPIQALVGLLFLVLIFARVVSALPRIDEVIDDRKHDA